MENGMRMRMLCSGGREPCSRRVVVEKRRVMLAEFFFSFVRLYLVVFTSCRGRIYKCDRSSHL